MAVSPSAGAPLLPAAGVTPEVYAGVKELVELLAVKSYRELGQGTSDEHASRLRGAADRLETALAGLGWFPAGTAAQPQPAVALAFALAYRLSALYPDTVGDADRVIASLPLPAMRRIRSGHASAEVQAAVFGRLAARLGLGEVDAADVEAEFQGARAKLQRRRQLVGLLRAELPPAPGPLEAHEFFGWFFLDHPLLPGEVDVAATESCLYFIILSNEAFARAPGFLARDEAGRKRALDYLERLRRFNFSNFSHFPAFTSFDAREMDPGRLAALAAAMGLESTDLVALLNTAVFVEERDNLDKYFVHDSWGHYWQADLTRLGSLYDRMATLQLPLSPSDTVRLGDERLGTFLDLVYLRRDGALLFDEPLARRFAAAWVAERFQPLLAPVIAELAVDMIEYRPDDQDGTALPSSSRFMHHVIFIVKLFERDPLRHFWSLDETLQGHAVPLLETLAACERETRTPAH